MAEIINPDNYIEILDVVDESGNPTGQTVSRAKAHAEGIRHRTSHVWLVREKDGALQVLLQKRSPNKDSFPGCYDISSAGHIPAGSDFAESAVRELNEELGIETSPHALFLCGQRQFSFDREFHGKMYHDKQVSNVYVFLSDHDEEAYTLQESEVSEVRWFDFDECLEMVETDAFPHCIYTEELLMVRDGARTVIGKDRKLRLIDEAARGSIDAAADLAEGYLMGLFGEPANRAKGLKWAGYAAKRGSAKASALLKM